VREKRAQLREKCEEAKREKKGQEEEVRDEDKGKVDNGMKRVAQELSEGIGGREVVSNATNGDGVRLVGTLNLLPRTKEVSEEVITKATPDELGDEEVVGDEGSLENDGHVARVEELNGISASNTLLALMLNGEINLEALREKC